MKTKRLICLTALFLLSAMCFGTFAVAAAPSGNNTPDVDRDGKVTEEDAKILLSELTIVGDDSKPRGIATANDVNDDGLFSVKDVTAVLNRMDALTTTSGSVSLRVGTFNIQNGGGVGHDFSVLAQDILDQGLDIVGLQEVDQFTSRNGGKDTMKELSEATGYKYYGFTKAINLSGDFEYTILKTIENGANPYFVVAYDNIGELKTNGYSEYYAVEFATWKETIVEEYKIDLPRPRNLVDPEFLRLRKEITQRMNVNY